MDRMYRLQRHVYDLTRHCYLLGRDRLLRSLPAAPRGTVLEMGCGTGRNLIRLSRMRPDLVLCGVDASEAMLCTARDKTRRAGICARLACRLAEDFDQGRDLGLSGGFDVVYFSYVLSMIPEPAAALEAAWKLVRPGGALCVVDFGDFAGLPAWFGRLLTGWLGLFAVRPKPELPGLLARLAGDGGGQLTREDHRGGYAVLFWLRKPAA
ncbi:MAG: class I SAM-dependent methyltransferase [Desulfovibrionaceae bacterium]|nr:class I SAM-dependent methyltransferase [Desulfovibrionaceae bacterium]